MIEVELKGQFSTVSYSGVSKILLELLTELSHPGEIDHDPAIVMLRFG